MLENQRNIVNRSKKRRKRNLVNLLIYSPQAKAVASNLEVTTFYDLQNNNHSKSHLGVLCKFVSPIENELQNT